MLFFDRRLSLKNRFHLTYCGDYGMWLTMMRACYNPKSRDYKTFGAKGYRVSESWKNFEAFLDDTRFSGRMNAALNSTSLKLVFKEDGNLFCKENIIAKDIHRDRVVKNECKLKVIYENYKQILNEYSPKFCTFARNLRIFIPIEWMTKFDDPEKLKLLLRYARKDNKTVRDKFTGQFYYMNLVEHFYSDPQFNKVYDNWIRSDKDGKVAPALDHIRPKSKGGTNDLSNLRFITNIENYFKGTYSLEEWEYIKNNPDKFFI